MPEQFSFPFTTEETPFMKFIFTKMFRLFISFKLQNNHKLINFLPAL